VPVPWDVLYHFIFGSKYENASGRFKLLRVDGESFLEISSNLPTQLLRIHLLTTRIATPFTSCFVRHRSGDHAPQLNPASRQWHSPLTSFIPSNINKPSPPTVNSTPPRIRTSSESHLPLNTSSPNLLPWLLSTTHTLQRHTTGLTGDLFRISRRPGWTQAQYKEIGNPRSPRELPRPLRTLSLCLLLLR
jgi:hypothetical protein